MSKTIRVALVGQPNVGKSLLINSLSGSHLKVGNFSGVTVEKAEANLKFRGYEIIITDLPGTYAIQDYTLEERVASGFLKDKEYDVILDIVDSTNLQRNLFLTAQLMELGQKMVLALNMSDEAKKEGIDVDNKQLTNVLGFPAIKVSAAKKTGLDELLEAVVKAFEEPLCEPKRVYSDMVEESLNDIGEFIEAKPLGWLKEAKLGKRELVVGLLKKDKYIYSQIHDKPIWMELQPLVNKHLQKLYKVYASEDAKEIFDIEARSFARGAVKECVSRAKMEERNLTQRIDTILLHKIFGIPIFLFFMWSIFQLTFELGSIPADWIDALFVSIGEGIKNSIPSEAIASLLGDGVIGGVGAVIMFLPNIMILFFGIALLESTGYMSRVAFLLDGFFHKFGLHGKSFIPLVTGFGCSVPAYMSTRTLKSKKDRILTLFIINFMSCGAKLPVYVLFIGAFLPESYAGNALFGLYIFGALVGLVLAKILRMTVFREKDEPFVMEMPKYRVPSLRLIWFMIWNKSWMYLKKAGTFILAASMLIWFASNYPANDALEAKYNQKIELATTAEEVSSLSHEYSQKRIEASYLGEVGKFIEPAFAPLGFDWKMSVALVAGLSAKEVVVSTLGVLYSLGDEVDEESKTLKEILSSSIPLASAMAFIVFVMFYNPCLAATVVFGKEAGEVKYIYYNFIFTTIVAYIFALLAYVIFSAI
ncbi:MAG: ferrous iron transport protein B [Campylobacterales bacterium]